MILPYVLSLILSRYYYHQLHLPQIQFWTKMLEVSRREMRMVDDQQRDMAMVAKKRAERAAAEKADNEVMTNKQGMKESSAR